MFKLISTLLRGRAHDAEQAFADRNAVPLLAQQIRDAAQSIQSARRSVAIAIAQNEQERIQHATIISRIDDLETRASAALAKGNEGLAREAAEAIAYLEAERDQSEKAQAQFTTAIDKLKELSASRKRGCRNSSVASAWPAPPKRRRSSMSPWPVQVLRRLTMRRRPLRAFASARTRMR